MNYLFSKLIVIIIPVIILLWACTEELPSGPQNQLKNDTIYNDTIWKNAESIIIDSIYKIGYDTSFIIKIDSSIDTLIVQNIDTIFIIKYDTIFTIKNVRNVDTFLIFDTISLIDTIFNSDTVLVEHIDSIWRFDTIINNDHKATNRNIKRFTELLGEDTLIITDSFYISDTIVIDRKIIKKLLYSDVLIRKDTSSYTETIIDFDTAYNIDTLIRNNDF